jgi:hypothetical protein
MLSLPLRKVTEYYRDHRELTDGFARFAPGDAVRDADTGHSGVIDALYGPGPVFDKALVRFNNGTLSVLPDARLQCDVQHPVVKAVALRYAVPAEVVVRVFNESVDLMRARDRYLAPSDASVPALDYPRYPRHTPKLQSWQQDPMESYIDYLDVVDPFEVIPSEPEGNIRSHPTFQQYVRWYQEGHLPPYPAVFEQIHDGQRKLLGANRRRILAARAAGVRELPIWLGRWNCETGLPLKYGDILSAGCS